MSAIPAASKWRFIVVTFLCIGFVAASFILSYNLGYQAGISDTEHLGSIEAYRIDVFVVGPCYEYGYEYHQWNGTYNLSDGSNGTFPIYAVVWPSESFNITMYPWNQNMVIHLRANLSSGGFVCKCSINFLVIMKE